MKHLIAFAALIALAGCLEDLEKQTQKSPDSIIGKTTQDVGKFDPNAGAQVSDSKVNITDPITAPVTGPLQAYGPMLEQISKTQIEHALRLFQAEHDRFPRDYDEFMEEIIRKNNIKLPVLPGGAKYQYDEQEHKLVIVTAEGAPAGNNAPPAGDKPAPTGGPQLPNLP